MRGGDPAGPQLALQGQVEIRRVYAQEQIGRVGGKMPQHRAAYPQQLRQALERLDETHDRQALHGEHTVQALGLHQGSADTFHLQLAKPGAQCLQHPGAENISRGLPGQHTDSQCHGGACPPETAIERYRVRRRAAIR